MDADDRLMPSPPLRGRGIIITESDNNKSRVVEIVVLAVLVNQTGARCGLIHHISND